MTQPRIIRTRTEYAQARGEYRALTRQAIAARNAGDTETAKRITLDYLPLERALEAYERVDPITTDEEYARAFNAYETLKEYGRTDGTYAQRTPALIRQYEHALTTYDALNGRR